MKEIVIKAGKSRECSCVNEALKAAAEYEGCRVTIMLDKGVYNERVEIRQPYITLKGSSAEDTVITYGLSANEIMPDNEKRGTFRSYSVFIDADHFRAENISFANSAGPGTKVGQALAVYADSDMAVFKNCRLTGGQDTLFTAPLPEKEFQKNGFRGPKEHAPRKPCRQLYDNCYISGDVDFIFGGASAWFEGCEIHSNNTGKEINGYVTAASTAEGLGFGYVFNRCRFTGDCPDESVYLGRPWREYAKVIIMNSWIGPHIVKEGWTDWNKDHDHFVFREYGNEGPGAFNSARADFAKQLSDEEALKISKEEVLGDWIYEADNQGDIR